MMSLMPVIKSDVRGLERRLLEEEMRILEEVRKGCIMVVHKCSVRYGFSAEEAISELGLNEMCIKKKVKKEVKLKYAIPFPDVCIEGWCRGIKYNSGLFTQCMNKRCDELLCKGCRKEADNNESGLPTCGLVETRVEMGENFVDSKGRKPVHYTKYMEKNSITRSEVILEAAKIGIVPDEKHFIKPAEVDKRVKKEKKVGRPQKEEKIVETNDIFNDTEVETVICRSLQPTEDEKEDEKDDEKEDEKDDEKEDEKDDEKEDEVPVSVPKKTAPHKEAEKKADKERKEAEKAAEKERKEAEKKADKERKEAEKKADKERKEAEKKAEKERKEAEKKAEKGTKKKSEKKTKQSVIEPEEVFGDELQSETYDENSNGSEEEEETQTVVTFRYEGVKYGKDPQNNVYDLKTGEIIGKLLDNGNVVFNETEEEEEEPEEEDEDKVETDDED